MADGEPGAAGEGGKARAARESDHSVGRGVGGKVESIGAATGAKFALLPPDNATGNFTKVVQRVPVKIALDDSTGTKRLRSGLSAVVTVRTKP